ncbi:hypothetical protein BJ508DRAFT_409999 [Ascobolus immersus RN42]|uniref:MARVEL domain-containing protein n=1 Tax=Ascobolus immersus RN42 TaxID=1160509 RepID=A0A3N4IV58_ASCIM|nr:hypothetical protein BJ508DRAFT_409999 [Ascobolus immersus RN42]
MPVFSTKYSDFTGSMARSETTSIPERISYRGTGRRYRWPNISLSIILFIQFICGVTVLGIFAYLAEVQKRLYAPVPWYFYFLIIVGLLTIFFVFGLVTLYYMHLLLPIYVGILSFILFVLWLTGLIKASIDLWGPLGSVNDNCTRYVFTDQEWGGRSVETLARIQQIGVCNMWKTSFALELIATVLFMFMLFMCHQVWSRAVRD